MDRSWEDQTGDANSQRGKSPPPSRAERRKTKAPTFMAHYLGDAPVAESELIPGQCVKVVHSCINKLTTGKESKWKRKSSSHSEEKVCGCVGGCGCVEGVWVCGGCVGVWEGVWVCGRVCG